MKAIYSKGLLLALLALSSSIYADNYVTFNLKNDTGNQTFAIVCGENPLVTTGWKTLTPGRSYTSNELWQTAGAPDVCMIGSSGGGADIDTATLVFGAYHTLTIPGQYFSTPDVFKKHHYTITVDVNRYGHKPYVGPIASATVTMKEGQLTRFSFPVKTL